jgi:hypothetical protein
VFILRAFASPQPTLSPSAISNAAKRPPSRRHYQPPPITCCRRIDLPTPKPLKDLHYRRSAISSVRPLALSRTLIVSTVAIRCIRDWKSNVLARHGLSSFYGERLPVSATSFRSAKLSQLNNDAPAKFASSLVLQRQKTELLPDHNVRTMTEYASWSLSQQ